MNSLASRMPLLNNGFQWRPYQEPFLKAMDNGKQFAALVWARRHGKDLTCWNYAIGRALEEPMMVTYVYPTNDMARDNLWEAKTNDGMDFLDYIPMEVRRSKNSRDDGANDSTRRVYLKNGSVIRLASAEKPGRLRGGNSKLYILSELAEMSPEVLDIIEPVVEANGGQIIANFTPRGANHAKSTFDTWSLDDRAFTQVITAKDTDVFTDEQLERIKRNLVRRWTEQGRSETEAVAFFEQEYLCSFDTPIVGAYYGEALKRAEEEGRITSVPYDENAPVYSAWDLGMGDSTAIWFWQNVGQEIHVIDYYEMSGEALKHYAKHVKEKPYLYNTHFLPHDARARELGTGKSREETLQSYQLGKIEILPASNVDDGIDEVRKLLGRCWFDKERCKRGLDALANYKKEYDEKNQIWKAKAKHNWASHGADAFRYLAMGQKKERPAPTIKRQAWASRARRR